MLKKASINLSFLEEHTEVVIFYNLLSFLENIPPDHGFCFNLLRN